QQLSLQPVVQPAIGDAYGDAISGAVALPERHRVLKREFLQRRHDNIGNIAVSVHIAADELQVDVQSAEGAIAPEHVEERRPEPLASGALVLMRPDVRDLAAQSELPQVAREIRAEHIDFWIVELDRRYGD